MRFPQIVTPSTAEQAGTLVTMYNGDGIPKRLFVEECLRLLKRPDLEQVMQMLFPGDGDGMELKTEADMDALEAVQTGQGAPDVEPSDANPLAMGGVGESLDFVEFR